MVMVTRHRVCWILLLTGFLVLFLVHTFEPVVVTETTERSLLSRTGNQECQGQHRVFCVPPLLKFEKRFRTARQYRLNVCAIEKNLSTILTAIVCFLYREAAFRKSGRDLNKEYFARRFCKSSNEAGEFSALELKFNTSIENWLHVVAVREPVERFISGFVDKCVLTKVYKQKKELCNGCQGNVTCFLEREYARMLAFADGARLNSFDDRHFFPQNWRCQFYEHLRRFHIIHFSAKNPDLFLEDFYALLRGQNVKESSIEFVKAQLQGSHTPHSTSDRKERDLLEKQVLESRHNMLLITRMYYYDYTLFGFPLPEIPE